NEAAVATFRGKRMEEFPLQLHVLRQRRSNGDAAAICGLYDVDEVHRVASNGVGHDMTSIDATAARLSACPDCASVVAMWRTISAATFDAWVKGPMCPAPSMTSSRLSGSSSANRSATMRDGFRACSPRMMSTGHLRVR